MSLTVCRITVSRIANCIA